MNTHNRLLGKERFENESHPSIPGWTELLDQVKVQLGLTSDAKLASTLGVTRGYLCSIRKGRKGVSLNLARKIHSLLGREVNLTELQGLFVPVRHQRFARNFAMLRQFVVQRADGNCQLCGYPAPFLDNEGNPYLEVHHIIPIQNGGTDNVDNMVALCPNCHRKMIVRPTKPDIEKLQRLADK